MDWEDGTCILDGKGREHMQRKVFEKKIKVTHYRVRVMLIIEAPFVYFNLCISVS